MIDCRNCRGRFDPDESTSQDPEKFCGSRCEDAHLGAVDPNELGTFSEVLEHWTRRGGPTADEKTAFWASWTRHTIVWAFVLIGTLVVAVSYGGLICDIGLIVTIYAWFVMAGQAVEAVRFVREARHW
jgi:hypothetical protein